MKIKNLLNSPVDIQTLSGPIVLAAHEEREIQGFPPSYDRLYRASSFFEVTESEADPLEPFRVEYERLTGKKADKRWSETRLFEELEKAES